MQNHDLSLLTKISICRIVLVALFLIVFGALSETWAQCGPVNSTTANQPKPCRSWKYGFLSGTDTSRFDWDNWYREEFPGKCYIESNLQCFWESADSACKAAVKEAQQLHKNNGLPQAERPFHAVTITAVSYQGQTQDLFTCKYRKDNKQNLPPEDYTTVYAEPQQMQAHCLVNFQGPYRYCSDIYYAKGGEKMSSACRGAEFSKKKKDNCKNLNKMAHNNQIISDIVETSVPLFPSTCAGPLIEPTMTNLTNPCRAEVHHIVPSRDQHSCPCGTNSYKNALVISKELNDWISNDPARAETVRNMISVGPYSNNTNCKAPSTIKRVMRIRSMLIPYYEGDRIWNSIMGSYFLDDNYDDEDIEI